MRKFKCLDCNHTWEIIFGEEKPGVKQACPACKSLNVHRLNQNHEERTKPQEFFPEVEEELLKQGTYRSRSSGPKAE
jgi:hypothetical protein